MMYFILSCAGLTWIMVHSSIFRPIREGVSRNFANSGNAVTYSIFWFLNGILNCSGCFGFWSGIINYLLIYKLQIDISILQYGFIGSISSLIIIQFFSYLKK